MRHSPLRTGALEFHCGYEGIGQDADDSFQGLTPHLAGKDSFDEPATMDRVCFGSRIGLRARLILERVAQGDEDARHELLDRVYGELRQLATRKMSREAPGQTLQPTALVHEAWLKLCGYDDPRWEDRRQFVAFTLEETAEALGVSVPTAIRWWAFSRAWLLHRMEGTADPLR